MQAFHVQLQCRKKITARCSFSTWLTVGPYSTAQNPHLASVEEKNCIAYCCGILHLEDECTVHKEIDECLQHQNENDNDV